MLKFLLESVKSFLKMRETCSKNWCSIVKMFNEIQCNNTWWNWGCLCNLKEDRKNKCTRVQRADRDKPGKLAYYADLSVC